IRNYTDVWVKLLRFIWRTWDLAEGDRPGYKLLTTQRTFLMNVMDLARRDDGDDDIRSQLVESLGQFWLSMFQHELGDDHHESALVSGLAILGLNTEDGSWARPENFSSTIAALVTIGKALVVRQAWKQREDEI
ncbi:hypothetical protein BDZ85DRAFT_184388, partial [Elsinoe ampelina]